MILVSCVVGLSETVVVSHSVYMKCSYCRSVMLFLDLFLSGCGFAAALFSD